MEPALVESRPSLFVPMFEMFRAELDEHHDRREKIIKASRDITAASKKIIFALQRVRNVGKPIAPFIKEKTQPHYEIIANNFASVVPDLQGINEHRYGRNITGGIQEYMEAVIFEHYLETQNLLSLDDAATNLGKFAQGNNTLGLSAEDYLLGILDMTGELMRFAITSMATSGNVPGEVKVMGADSGSTNSMAKVLEPRSVLNDMRKLRGFFESLDAGSDYHFSKDVAKKLEVLQASVEKVEKAQYGLIVRGSERPKGWIPDIRDEARGMNEAEA